VSRPASGAEPNYKDRETLGRSRGGLASKVHLLADARCRPLARVTSAGQRHDSLAFLPLMDRLKVTRAGPGRPRTRPGRLLGDKAYSSAAIRAHLRQRGIKATIPEPAGRCCCRAGAGCGPSATSASTAPPPPDTTNATSSGAAPSTWPRSGSGSAIPSHDLRDTL